MREVQNKIVNIKSLGEDVCGAICSHVEPSYLGELAEANRFFSSNNVLQNRRRQYQHEYTLIKPLLDRYSIPVPLGNPDEFKRSLVKSASIVEKQIYNVEKSRRGMLYFNYKYLFYSQLESDADIYPNSLDIALKYFNYELAYWLIDREHQIKITGDLRLIFSQNTLTLAARAGSLELVKWLTDTKRDHLRPNEETLNAAVESGNLALVQWLVDEEMIGDDRFRPNEETLNAAVESGSLALVQWLMDAERGDDRLRPDQDTLNSAAMSGDFEMFKWLLIKCEAVSASISPNKHTLDEAACSGSIEIMELLMGDLYSVQPDQYSLVKVASSGNIKAAQWLIDTSYEYIGVDLTSGELDDEVINQAAANGHFEMVRYLYDDPFSGKIEEGYGIDEGYYVLKNAALSGNYEMFLWLERGFENVENNTILPGEEFLIEAVKSNNFKLIKWLMDDGRGGKKTFANADVLSASRIHSLNPAVSAFIESNIPTEAEKDSYYAGMRI